MNYEDFIRPKEGETDVEVSTSENEPVTQLTEGAQSDLNVQMAVVQSLAEDKAAQDEQIETLKSEKDTLHKKCVTLESEMNDLKENIETMKQALEKVGDVLSANAEQPLSTKITLLERLPEIDDRFEGETREHVLEVLREAREHAENEGHRRRAQLLESVLMANESSGELSKRRQQLEKIFTDNLNVVNGQVISELEKLSVTYKEGEKYLTAAEIINRNY